MKVENIKIGNLYKIKCSVLFADETDRKQNQAGIFFPLLLHDIVMILYKPFGGAKKYYNNGIICGIKILYKEKILWINSSTGKFPLLNV